MAYYYGDGNYKNPSNNRNKKPDNGELFSWALIAFLFLVGLWPVGLVLLISKLSDGVSKKKPAARKSPAQQQQQQQQQVAAEAETAAKTRTSKAVARVTHTPQYGKKGSRIMRIIGWVLTAIGGIALLDTIGDAISIGSMSYYLEELFFSTGFLTGGLGLLFGSWKMKRRARRFAKYLAAAGKNEAIDINRLAEAAEVSEPKAEKDLEIMVEKGMWGAKAYVDSSNDMLFRSQEAAAKYFEAKNPGRQHYTSAPREAEEGYSGMLRNIRRANDRIADPELSAKIDRLEEITARIFKTIEEHPNRKEKANTFLNYYLPTTQKLLDSYADFEEAGVSGANLSQAKARIEKTMDNIVAGFEHQLDELYQAEAMDVDSDIRVMESMLRRDTSTVEDDFGLNGGTAVQEWDGE